MRIILPKEIKRVSNNKTILYFIKCDVQNTLLYFSGRSTVFIFKATFIHKIPLFSVETITYKRHKNITIKEFKNFLDGMYRSIK